MQEPYGQDLSRIVTGAKTPVLGGSDQLGIAHLRNVDTVADVSVAEWDGRWRMVLGATSGDSPVIGLFSARLPRDATPASPDWVVDTEPDDADVAKALLPPPPADAWDATGYHCPTHVRAGAVRRIYYASTSERTLYGPYRIGCLEWDGGRWHRHPEPVFTAEMPWERETVLEPNVVYAGGRWRIYYASGLTATKSAVIGCAESRDGLTGWRHRRLELDTDEFDAAVVEAPDGYHRVIARHPAHRPVRPGDGLWWSSASRLDNPEWTPAVQLVDSVDGTPWHQGGVWKPSVVPDPKRPGHGHVFFNGVAFTGNRPTFTVGRVAYGISP